MKKILSLMVAALSLLALSSCMKENFNNGADEATMTLNISMPDEVATKAYGDGMFDAKNVIIGVFDEDGKEKFRKVYVWEKDVFQQEVTIQFVMGKTYQMVLWAQYGNAYGDPKEMSLEKITLDYKKSNREDLDAFYAYVEPFRVTEDFSKSITLKRPFAQLNFATTVGDMDESIAAGDLGIHNKAQVTVKNLANTLNLFTGKTSYVAADKTETESGVAVIIPETEFPKVDNKYPTIKVEETVYEVISMNYVLVADADAQDGKTTVDLELKVGDLVIEVPGANMKRNWRTNVVGELLTGEGTFTVKIDQNFDGTYNENWNDGTGTETPDQPEVEESEWKLLGSHNEWKTEEFMVLENGLAVARGVEFPATKAEGDGEFKVSNGTDWYGMAVAATVGADKYLAASKDNAANILVAPGKYDIWFDAAKAIIYVMTPGKAIKEATEFKAPQPEEPDQPETETWGIVGTFNSWGGQDLAMTAVKIGEVEYWFADNFAVAADAAFKFRYTDGDWDNANVYGAAGAVAVDAASELMQPGNDISVAAGTYDIYLDVKNALVYVMTDGKTPADVAAPDRTDVEIYVVKAADWTNLYAWGELATGAWPGKAFQETVTINEVEYNKWTLSVATTKIGQKFQLIFNNGNDVKTADSEEFEVAEKMYFKVVDKTVVKIEAPVVEEPEQPEPIVPAVALSLVSTEVVPAEGGNVVVKVTSNVAWTLALDGTKVTEGAEAVADFEVTVKVEPNTTTEVVNHTLLLSDVPAEGAQAVTATAPFTQAAAQPEEPEVPEAFKAGEYFIMDGTGKMVTPIAESSTYGYWNVQNAVEDGNGYIGYAENVFTITAVEGGYTIQDVYGRHHYMTTYNSFSVSTSTQADNSHVWTITLEDDGAYAIVNTVTGKTVQFTSYNNYAPYTDVTGKLPYLVKADKIAEKPAQPDVPEGEAAKFATNVKCTTGENAYTDGVANVNEVPDVYTLKLGTSKKNGVATITIPAGTTKVTYYAVGWNGTSAKLKFTVDGNAIAEQALAANSGATGNAPYTMTVTDTDKYSISLGTALETDLQVKVETIGSAYRAILFGIQAE